MVTTKQKSITDTKRKEYQHIMTENSQVIKSQRNRQREEERNKGITKQPKNN